MSTETDEVDDFDIFVGGRTGAFKGLKVGSKKKGIIVKNLQDIETLKPEDEISILNWSDHKEEDILVGSANQTVKIYDAEYKDFSCSLVTKFGTGPLVGLTRIKGAITTCSQSGDVKVWTPKTSEEMELQTGDQVSKMQKYNGADGIIATGGEQNDLKVWDIETKQKIFCAKNVKKDMLELEVPVWVSDIAFLPNNEYKIVVSTRHGQIRLYDTKAQRRPVVDINLVERPLNTISLCYDENLVVVGSATGHILLADLRCKGKILHAYKGAVGSIRQVAAHPTLPYVASVGLDRHIRIHHLQTKKLLHQGYLKVRLNCVLMKSSFGKEVDEKRENAKRKEKTKKKTKSADVGSDEEYNELFDNMESVGDEAKGPIRKKSRKK